MRRPIRMLIGTATGLGLAAVAWLASRSGFWESEPRQASRAGAATEKPEAPKAAPRRTRASASRSRAARTTAKGASARKAPVARRSRPRA